MSEGQAKPPKPTMGLWKTSLLIALSILALFIALGAVGMAIKGDFNNPTPPTPIGIPEPWPVPVEPHPFPGPIHPDPRPIEPDDSIGD